MINSDGVEGAPMWICADANGNPYFYCQHDWRYFPRLKFEIRDCRRRGGEASLLQGQDALDAIQQVKTFWPEHNPAQVSEDGGWFHVAPDYPHEEAVTGT